MEDKATGKKVLAIIPSGGMGRRMGSKRKNYLPLNGVPVLARALAPFEASTLVTAIVVVVGAGDEDFCRREIVDKHSFKKVVSVTAGGPERQDSVYNGVRAAGGGWDYMVVHDGARPLVTLDAVEDTLRAARRSGCAVSAVRVKDTVKEVSGGVVKRTLPRDLLWAVHTPQAFRADILSKALEAAASDGFLGTDESSLVERLGFDVTVVEGSYENIKITTGEDMALAGCILDWRESGGR
ncbi:MAG: 2-C-methyl-D-erythritol 4-phosphate cytidylyltransferase [Deltaproteobacteria bacterium]|nr:2-C-methyl-D-erythritol 4-phosphate cytidylyltransferase [Deltaproteobacteria bacterium]